MNPEGSPITVHITGDCEDNARDSFLSNSPRGQWEQTCAWAKVKQHDGWHPVRKILTADDRIIGGVMIIFRPKRYVGNIGFIWNGPVVLCNDKESLDLLVAAIKEIVRSYKIRVLFVQPPDRHPAIADLLKKKDSWPTS
jgi:lipid II:glycine glycyltransferase (peptidoglycan interpeptide bridge formation enzyme)